MKPLWPSNCEHNFPLPGCEVCNLYPSLEGWLKSPAFEQVCQRLDGGVARLADVIDVTWTAASAQLLQRIARLEQELRVQQKQGQLYAADSTRWRWLRERHDDGDEQWFVYGAKSEGLDSDIDEAMKSSHEEFPLPDKRLT